jgi:hypothetical protein
MTVGGRPKKTIKTILACKWKEGGIEVGNSEKKKPKTKTSVISTQYP